MQLTSKIMSVVFALTGFIGVTSTASAACWWQWQGVNSKYVCDECGDSGCSTLSSGGSSGATYETLQIKNECFKHGDIWAAIHFRDLNDNWQTSGFWKIAPGQTIVAGSTKNTIFYVHAYAANGGTNWSGNDGTWQLYGKDYNFFKVQGKFNGWGTFTQRLTCN